VLARTMEKCAAGKIRSVYIGIEFDDETFDADWSQMLCSKLTTHAMVAQKLAMDELKPEGNDG
jgi:hypothetical protein